MAILQVICYDQAGCCYQLWLLGPDWMLLSVMVTRTRLDVAISDGC